MRLATLKQRPGSQKQPGLQNDGRGERIRTFDPLVPNQMRYQAALRPDNLIVIAEIPDSGCPVPCSRMSSMPHDTNPCPIALAGQ